MLGVQIITTVPSFTQMLGIKKPVPMVPLHTLHYYSSQPNLSKISTRKESYSGCQDSMWKSISSSPGWEEFTNPALGIVALPLLCGVHCYYSRTLEEKSLQFPENQTFYFPVFFLSRYNTPLMFEKSRWHNWLFCMSCMPPSFEKGSKNDNKGLIHSSSKVPL